MLSAAHWFSHVTQAGSRALGPMFSIVWCSVVLLSTEFVVGCMESSGGCWKLLEVAELAAGSVSVMGEWDSTVRRLTRHSGQTCTTISLRTSH